MSDANHDDLMSVAIQSHFTVQHRSTTVLIQGRTLQSYMLFRSKKLIETLRFSQLTHSMLVTFRITSVEMNSQSSMFKYY